MTLYKLKRITDLNGENKTDEQSVNRLNRVFDIREDGIFCGHCLFMKCVEPSYEKSLYTSRVRGTTITDSELIITTENSIYYLEKKE